VAPIYRPGNIRSVYLPEGRWVDFWSGEILNGPLHIKRYLTNLSQLPLFLFVNQSTLELFIDPLLDQQLTDLEDRVEYFARGVKKYLLRLPHKRLLEQMEKFRASFPDPDGHVTPEDILVLQNGVKAFTVYVQGEYQRGHFPDHVYETLSQRLEMVELNMMLQNKLTRALDK